MYADITDNSWFPQVQFSMVKTCLEALGIPCYEGVRGGLFVWANISGFLPETTFEAERDFAKKLIEKVKKLTC